jgi:proteasome lid subunit RPN8/RPN11
MTEETIAQIRAHAEQEFPRECCGLIIVQRGREVYWPCRNLATEADRFHLHHEDYASAEEAGDVLAIVHSHPNIAPTPSQADLVACEQSGLPWVIVSWPTGEIYEFAPTGYVAPLVGRVFAYGVLDCYSLCKDYYLRECGITLPPVEHRNNWWLMGQDLYLEHFTAQGFIQIEERELRKHDAILMQVSKTTTNHAAIYLGDGLILHHPMNRLSGREVYGGFWQKISTRFLRHKELA